MTRITKSRLGPATILPAFQFPSWYNLAHLVAELGELKRPAVLVGLAGVGAAAGVTKLLLELAVVLIAVLVIVGLDVDVGALVLG